MGLDYTPHAQGIFANPALGQMPFYGVVGGSHEW